MTSRDPRPDSESSFPHPAPDSAEQARFVLPALAAAPLALAVYGVPVAWSLVRQGDVSPLSLLLGVVATCLLAISGLRILLRGRPTRLLVGTIIVAALAAAMWRPVFVLAALLVGVIAYLWMRRLCPRAPVAAW